MATGELISPGIPAQLKREQEENQRHHAAMEESEREAEAARWLTRSLFVHRVGGAMAWVEQLKAWGDAQAHEVVQAVEAIVGMDSTKRKRRRKMSKHKYVASRSIPCVEGANRSTQVQETEQGREGKEAASWEVDPDAVAWKEEAYIDLLTAYIQASLHSSCDPSAPIIFQSNTCELRFPSSLQAVS